MKTQTLILALVLIAGYACTPGGTDNDNRQAIDEMERFVDSLETEVSTSAQHNWTEVERAYTRLNGNAQRIARAATDEEKTEIERLEQRYEKLKADAEREAEQMSAEADRHLQTVENWFERTTENIEQEAENIGEATEQKFDESKVWIERNYEKLEDSTKRRYDELKEKMSNDQ